MDTKRFDLSDPYPNHMTYIMSHYWYSDPKAQEYSKGKKPG